MSDRPWFLEAVFRFRGALLALVAVPIVAEALGPATLEVWEVALGLTLLASGAGTRVLSVRRIGKRARVRTSGAARLLCEGPFARVRNPLYLGNLSIAAGSSVLSGLGAWTVPLVAYGLTVYTVVVLAEERTLADLFGTRYEEYLRRVPRWLPRLTAAAAIDAGDAPLHPWSDVLAREGPTMLLGVAAAAAGLLWARLEGPCLIPVREAVDRASAFLHVPRIAAVALVVVAIAAGEALVTDAKRRRHERQRTLAKAGEGPPPAT